MKVEFSIPFHCPSNMTVHLQRVFSGEYDGRINFPSSRIIDLGANCGAFSLWALHRWPGSTVWAYEPDPKTFEYLKANVQNYPQILAHPYGIGSPGLRVLSNGPNNCGENSFHAADNNPFPTGQHLEVRSPLELPEADVLKMDIEGCELEVLEPLIKDKREFTYITLEWHNHKLRRAVDLLLADYDLVSAEVQSIYGRGVSGYLRKGILR